MPGKRRNRRVGFGTWELTGFATYRDLREFWVCNFNLACTLVCHHAKFRCNVRVLTEDPLKKLCPVAVSRPIALPSIPAQTIHAGAVSSKPKPRLFRQLHFYFAIALCVAVGGFWPSFFSKLASTDRAHLIHGVSATLWMTVPIVQSWLIGRRRFKLHRQLGWITLAVLAPILVISGLHMVQLMVLRYEQTHAIRLLKFTFLDLCAMTLFVTSLVLAIIRQNRALIGRGTGLVRLGPKCRRLRLQHSEDHGLVGSKAGTGDGPWLR